MRCNAISAGGAAPFEMKGRVSFHVRRETSERGKPSMAPGVSAPCRPGGSAGSQAAGAVLPIHRGKHDSAEVK